MNPIAFELFGQPIYWYGIVIATGILLAVIVATVICKKVNYKDDIPFELLLLIVPIGIIGARLYYVIFSDYSYSFSELFDLRSGGIAIYGAVLMGALGVFVYTRIKKCSFFAIADLIVICLILAQSIGRWGNFFNGEAYGKAVNFSFFPLTVNIDGQAHLATFFYESFLNLIGFFILLKVFSKQKKHGTSTATYFIYYGVVRSIIEPLRTDSLMLGPLRVSVIVSIVLIILGFLLIYLNKIGKISQKDETLRQKKENANV